MWGTFSPDFNDRARGTGAAIRGSITMFFELMSRLQSGEWDLVSIATVMDTFGVPRVHPLLGDGELQKSLESVSAFFQAQLQAFP